MCHCLTFALCLLMRRVAGSLHLSCCQFTFYGGSNDDVSVLNFHMIVGVPDKAGFSSQKILGSAVTSSVLTYAWSTKCRRKKLIARFGGKSRDKSFKPN
jgi:hypothetical protein